MSPGDTITVLHVDDEPDFADLVGTFLEREDDRITVRTATSPAAGLTEIREHDIDCVVSDYDMPETNGIEFLGTVRDSHPDLPFILYTGKGSEEVASDAISAGVTDYLQKEGGTEQYAILANRIENAVTQFRAEQEIERTHEYYHTIFEHTSDIVMITDEAARIDYVAPSIERILGYAPDDIVGTEAFELIHADDIDVAEEALTDLMEGAGEIAAVEFRAAHADGSWRWVEARGRNLLDDPVINGILVNARDITEIRSSKHELESIVDNLPGYVYRHRYEKEWPLEFVKGSAEAVTGYTATELEDDVTLAEEIIHPDDREEVWRGVQDGLEENDRFDLTYRIITKGGELRWIRDQGQLIEDPTSGEELLDGFIVDVTDQQEHERERTRHRRRYESIFDDPNIFVGLLETDGTVLDINETAMAYVDASLDDVTGSQFVETPWFDQSSTAREKAAEKVNRAADGEYAEFEFELNDSDGEPYVVGGVFRPVQDTDDNVVSIIVSGRDTDAASDRG